MSAIDRIRQEVLARTTPWVNRKKAKAMFGEQVTLISNNCTGGVVIRDFGLCCDTPFVNSGVYGEDFLRLTTNLPAYLAEELVENKDGRFPYPSAYLGDVLIRFGHASDFERVKREWDRRKERVHLDNVFVLWVGYQTELPDSMLEKIAAVPYPKVVFLNHARKDIPYVFHIKGFEDQPGVGHVWYNQGLSGKKYYDQFDLISWFKRKKKMEAYL